MKFFDVEQNSDEWLELRAGKLTGSGFGKIMANYGKPFGDPAKRYAAIIATEQITGKPIGSNYTNQHMERGKEQEPLARMKYEDENFCTVKNGGFFDCGQVGVSPDGRPENDALIEIKSVVANVHYDNIRRQSYDPAYKWQFIGNMFYTNAKWIDFVSFCADFPQDKQIYVCRLERDKFENEFEMLQERSVQFFNLVREIKENILNSNYQTKAK